MTTVGLLLSPLDVLLFRDARPFESGDTGRTQWPTPATFAGLIRTHLMRLADIKPAKLHGLHASERDQRHWFGRLCFRGPWLYVFDPNLVKQWNRRNREDVNDHNADIVDGPLVAAPADMVRLGKGQSDPVRRLRPLDKPDLPGWSPPCPGMLPMWLPAAAEKTEPATGWLDHHELKRYLAGDDLDAWEIHPTECFAVREDRTGIGIDPDRLAADQAHGLIYSTSFWRLLPGVCFYGEVDWPDEVFDAPKPEDAFPKSLVLPWGGERRGVCVERLDPPFDWRSLEPSAPNGNLLTVLVTPGVFSNGTHPWKPREQGTLRAACVPKPLPISGWDMAADAAERASAQPASESADTGDENNAWNTRGRPRPTRFAVPAGAVYLWSRGKHNADQPPPRGLRSLCDKPIDADNGWGLALSGVWKTCSLNTKE
jgi:CRISPR type III-B/RAMP module-associated protein Cmr3